MIDGNILHRQANIQNVMPDEEILRLAPQKDMKGMAFSSAAFLEWACRLSF